MHKRFRSGRSRTTASLKARPQAVIDPLWRDALRRVGETSEARARWLLEFAWRDLTTLSVTERNRLEMELMAFIEKGYSEEPEAYATDPRNAARELAKCQEWIVAGLAELKRGQPWHISLEFRPVYAVLLDQRRVVRTRTPLTDELIIPFREATLWDIVPVFVQRLRFCQRQICGRPLIARKRQRFCTQRCARTHLVRKLT